MRKIAFLLVLCLLLQAVGVPALAGKASETVSAELNTLKTEAKSEVSLASLKAGSVIYSNAKATKKAVTLGKKATVAVLDRGKDVAKIQYAALNAKGKAELRKGYVKGEELKKLSKAQTEKWQNTKHKGAVKGEGGFMLVPVEEAAVSVKPEEAPQKPEQEPEELPKEQAAAKADGSEKDGVRGEEAVDGVIEGTFTNASEVVVGDYKLRLSDHYITDYLGTATVITIPKSLKVNGVAKQVRGISETAFARNTSITSITLPSAKWFTKVDRGAFQGCTGLKSVSIPNYVTEIGVDAFNGCTSLSSVSWSDKLEIILDSAFYGCSSLTGLSLPTSVLYISNNAFENCSGLVKVTLPEGLLEIGIGAFKGCTSLEGIYIPDSVTLVNNSAFENCTSALVLDLSTGLTEINNFAFKGCISLTELNIPKGIKRIGREAFANCSNLGIVDDIPKTVTLIAERAFADCSPECIYVINCRNAEFLEDAFGYYGYFFAYPLNKDKVTKSNATLYCETHPGFTLLSFKQVNFVNRCFKEMLLHGATTAEKFYWVRHMVEGTESMASLMTFLAFHEDFVKRLDEGSLTKMAGLGIIYNLMMNQKYSSATSNAAKKMKNYLNVDMSFRYVINKIARLKRCDWNMHRYGFLAGSLSMIEGRDMSYKATKYTYQTFKTMTGKTITTSDLNYWTMGFHDKSLNVPQYLDTLIKTKDFKGLYQTNTAKVKALSSVMYRAKDRLSNTQCTNQGKSLLRGMSQDWLVDHMGDTAKFRNYCRDNNVPYGRLDLPEDRDWNEMVTYLLYRCIKIGYDRNYKVDELNEWAGKIRRKQLTVANAVLAFVTSDECYDQYPDDPDVPGRNSAYNKAYVTMLYRVYLNRYPTAAELATQSAKLARKISRTAVARSISGTQEWRDYLKKFKIVYDKK